MQSNTEGKFFAVVGVPANNKRWNEMPDEMHLVFKEIESKVWSLRVWYFALPRVVGGTPTTAKRLYINEVRFDSRLGSRPRAPVGKPLPSGEGIKMTMADIYDSCLN